MREAVEIFGTCAVILVIAGAMYAALIEIPARKRKRKKELEDALRKFDDFLREWRKEQ